jgi:radical SAM superfamily enzyme YgiQ (UPF0313 family)
VVGPKVGANARINTGKTTTRRFYFFIFAFQAIHIRRWSTSIFIASGLRYDLAVRDSEYIKELVTHHVGGRLKIAPEHTEDSTLSKMMKPGIGSYYQFKTLFERYSKISRITESSERL